MDTGTRTKSEQAYIPGGVEKVSRCLLFAPASSKREQGTWWNLKLLPGGVHLCKSRVTKDEFIEEGS